MKELLTGITTRDVLAVLVVTAALLFNGISLITGRGPDAATMTLAGAVVGYYFKDSTSSVLTSGFHEENVSPPAIGDESD